MTRCDKGSRDDHTERLPTQWRLCGLPLPREGHLPRMMCVDDVLDDLDDWEVISGCHQNQTLVPQLIETLVSTSWLAQINILSILDLVQAYVQQDLPKPWFLMLAYNLPIS